MLKIVNAVAICEWIVDQFPGSPAVYLMRHPVPSALSSMRTHLLMAAAYLEHPTFGDTHLSPPQQRLTREIVHDGSDFERGVLEWCLDNLMPWRAVTTRRRSWPLVTYEAMLSNPGQELERLAGLLDLTALDRMLEHLREPSASTALAQRDRVRAGQADERMTRWRREVTEADESSALSIARAFEIDAYELGADMAVTLPGGRQA